MGKEQQSKYYDEIYSLSKRYAADYRSSPYLSTWALVMQIIDKVSPNPSVLDIGCGTGQFAEFITKHSRVKYTGIDFSPKAIEIAKARNYSARRAAEPPIFTVANVFDQFVWENQFDVYVIMETLEHIENDIEIISRIPAGAMVILTVPTFDDEGHVRYFKSREDVMKRYGPFVGSELSESGKSVEMIRSWYIIYGKRNERTKPIRVRF